jgi:hypothetical protein
LALLLPLPALAGMPVDVEIRDHSDGRCAGGLLA